ncbi:MAG: PDZ domain-containing protein [Planctomycetota bacterium]|nr:MAG: PDZ domain-containing protein [Planctomycetota bacterium]
MSLSDVFGLLVVIVEVAIALGTVIFVHELGHFAVAKWCGVKCEKFYLGFDIYGLKLFKRQWGETEYGIGILPLGGYVKMLGQDDNPGKAAEERERSQLKPEEGAENQAAEGELDPRSYLAKSVPQRMAIISAGVIMNVIFAFIFAVIAFGLGVPETVCGVSALMPGEPAWQADLQPGDRVLAIDDYDGPLRFRDLMSAVALGDMNEGVDFLIEREGVEKPFLVNIKPDIQDGRLVPMIGVASPHVPTLKSNPMVLGATPAAETGKFEPGDKIVAVNDTPVDSYADLVAQLTRHADESLSFSVERPVESDDDAQPQPPEKFEVTVEPRPMRTLGLVMTMGEITAVQVKSPAAEAGLRAGDMIETIDGEPVRDPMRLPEQLHGREGETVEVVVARKQNGKTETITKEITLRNRPWPEESSVPASPVAVPSLGLTYKVLATVREVVPDSPAAQAKVEKEGKASGSLSAGDEVVAAYFEAPELSQSEREERDADERVVWATPTDETIEFSSKEPNWPFLMTAVQIAPPGTKVVLELADGRTATLTPAAAEDWFYWNRGLRFAADETIIQASNFSEAVSLGWTETRDALLMVYKFLGRLGSGQVSPMALGGPLTIAQAAGSEAGAGISRLLLFLTMLSANLAVINFLPIPLLDGGHMVFLILEGIMRRPVSEKVVIAFHYVGFVFIISLMMFVFGLDFSRLFGAM